MTCSAPADCGTMWQGGSRFVQPRHVFMTRAPHMGRACHKLEQGRTAATEPWVAAPPNIIPHQRHMPTWQCQVPMVHVQSGSPCATNWLVRHLQQQDNALDGTLPGHTAQRLKLRRAPADQYCQQAAARYLPAVRHLACPAGGGRGTSFAPLLGECAAGVHTSALCSKGDSIAEQHLNYGYPSEPFGMAGGGAKYNTRQQDHPGAAACCRRRCYQLSEAGAGRQVPGATRGSKRGQTKPPGTT